MIYTPVLFLTSALVAATGFSFQGSPSYDSLLPALSTIPDQDTVEEQPGYMNALQPNFQGLVGSNSVSRVTRTAMREPEKGPACCGSAVIREFPMEITSTYTDCHPDIMKSGENGTFLNVMCNSLQCFAKKKGMVDAEGYVLPDEFVKVVSNWYTEDSLKTLVKSLVSSCIHKANAYAKEWLAMSGSEEICNLAPCWSYYCVQHQVTAECPEDLQVKSEHCDKLRKGFKASFQEWQNRGPTI